MTNSVVRSKFGIVCATLVAVLFSGQPYCSAACALQSGQPPQTQSPPPSASTSPPPSPRTETGAKQRKVWTNDDVVELRRPVDNYILEKEAKKAASAEAARKEAAQQAASKSKQAKEAPLDISLPSTAEQTDEMIRQTQSYVQETSNALDRTRKEILDTPAAQQADRTKEVNRLTLNLERLHRNLKALQEHRKSFDAKPAEGRAVSPSPN